MASGSAVRSACHSDSGRTMVRVRVVTTPASVRFMRSDDRSRLSCVSHITFTWHQCARRMGGPSRAIMPAHASAYAEAACTGRRCACGARNIGAPMPPDLLRSLGQRARARRLERGWTLREVAERSGVSPRFLVQLEAGRGNISVRRLADVARALEVTPASLIALPGRELPSRSSRSSACAAPARRPSAGGSRAACACRSSSSTGASSRPPT